MLKIVKYPSAVLKKKAKEVEKITPELLRLIGDMKVAMDKNQGIGLAAPQIGVSKQIFIVETAHSPSVSAKKGERKEKAFLNPKLLSKGKDQEADEEGCLSLPGLFLSIKRSHSIRVSCASEEGKRVIVEAEGLAARIFQHEMDHLQGKLIIDRISPVQRFKIRKELEQIKKTGRVKE